MEATLHWTRRDVWLRKLVYPAHTIPTAAAPALVATALAVHDGAFKAWPAAAAFFAGWLVQLGGVLVDNYENLVQQPEDREHPELVQALKQGLLTLGELKAAIYASYGLALGAGILLTAIAGAGVVLIGLASIAASWAYSAGPFPIGRRGLADPLFFIFFGIVSVAGVYYVQARALPVVALVLGIPLGALTTNILIIDDIRDRAFDAVKGKLTVAVRFGAQWSRAEFVGLLAIAYLAPLWLWQEFGIGALLPLLTAPHALSTARNLFERNRYEDLVPMTPRAGRLLLAYSILLAAGVALSA